MSESIITVCGWCPQLRILQFPRSHGQKLALVLNESGKIEDAWWLGMTRSKVEVSHGICEECRAQHFPTKAPALFGEHYIPERKNNDA